MANTANAKKKIKVDIKRRERNKAVRTGIKSVFKRAQTAVQENSSEAKSLVTAAVSAIDKAVSKGVVHKNKAARKKSRLAKKLHAAGASAKK